jgi:hypothetical protein
LLQEIDKIPRIGNWKCWERNYISEYRCKSARGNCRNKHRKQEEAVLEANTVGSMVRFVHFIVDIIAFLVVYADNWNFVSVRVFNWREWIYTAFGFLMVFSFVLYFQLWNLSFKTLGKFITKTKVVTLKGENLVLMI